MRDNNYHENADFFSGPQALNPDASREITQTLKAWSTGDQAALNRLMPRVFDELRRMARHYARQSGAWLPPIFGKMRAISTAATTELS